MTAAVVAAALAAMAPSASGCAAVAIGDPAAVLWAGEGAAVAAAIPARRAEFAAGRCAARNAMARLGWPPVALPATENRVPAWPRGLWGSIAHSSRVAIAVVRPESMVCGIDIEPEGAVGADLGLILGLPEELDACEGQGDAPTRLFCAKEAVQKALWPRARTLLAFHDVVLTRTDAGFAGRVVCGTSGLAAGTVFHGLWAAAGDHVLAGVFGREA